MVEGTIAGTDPCSAGVPRRRRGRSGRRGGKCLCVLFTERWEDYLPNDIASFPAGVAKALVSKGLAEPIDPAEIAKMIARANKTGHNE